MLTKGIVYSAIFAWIFLQFNLQPHLITDDSDKRPTRRVSTHQTTPNMMNEKEEVEELIINTHSPDSPLNPLKKRGVPGYFSKEIELLGDDNSASSTKKLANGLSETLVKYFGGKVISNVELTSIFYGNVADETKLIRFYSAIVDSTYIDWLCEYNTPTQEIGRGVYKGFYKSKSPPSARDGVVDDLELKKWLVGLFRNKILDLPTPNSYYPVHFSPKFKVVRGGKIQCDWNAFCGYHSTIDLIAHGMDVEDANRYVYFGVIPDQYNTSCNGRCGSNDKIVDNLFGVASHELMEAITDPQVGLSTYVRYPIAWYSPGKGEIGDFDCNNVPGIWKDNKITYLSQTGFSYKQQKCTTDGPKCLNSISVKSQPRLKLVGQKCNPKLKCIKPLRCVSGKCKKNKN